MINLLPLEEKRGIRTRYILRAIVSFLWMLFVVVIASSILLLPSLLLSSLKQDIAESKMASLEKRENFTLDEASTAFITDANAKVGILMPFAGGQKAKAGDVFAKILGYKDNDIKISGMTFTAGADGARSVQLSGMAGSREGLLRFLKKFESDGTFAKADLPVGSFIKNKDLEFNFNLKLAD